MNKISKRKIKINMKKTRGDFFPLKSVFFQFNGGVKVKYVWQERESGV